ncbi:Translation initiation factor IF-2 [Frankliniella fusca]|uniref:Translation initiation factor IF-2 n=1 Tax=Frankliniella fusca TaxID=407009 RepID=A0AAE1L9Y7_9NEOP|nr:Translation initiation factor IF-2 [Frankliniella fusca]
MSFVLLADLPPTSDRARQHSLRVYLTVQDWLGNSLDPTQWGWYRGERSLHPVPSKLSPAPQELLHLIAGNFKAGCRAGSGCSCRKAELPCTPACGKCRGTVLAFHFFKRLRLCHVILQPTQALSCPDLYCAAAEPEPGTGLDWTADASGPASAQLSSADVPPSAVATRPVVLMPRHSRYKPAVPCPALPACASPPSPSPPLAPHGARPVRPTGLRLAILVGRNSTETCFTFVATAARRALASRPEGGGLACRDNRERDRDILLLNT